MLTNAHGWVMLAATELLDPKFYLHMFLFVVLPAALVSPAVWARKRDGWNLLALGLGIFLSAASFVEALHAAVQYQRRGELWDGWSCLWVAVYAALLGTGLIGVWRWFRLPRG